MGRKPKDTTKHMKGVKIRQWKSGRTTLMVQFYYQAVVYRETLSIDATPANINYASRLRSEIINAIERNTFNYADFFPNSKHAKQLGHAATRVLISDLLDMYIAEKKEQLEKSSYTRMKRNCQTHLYPQFGTIAIQDLKSVTIKHWIKTLTCKKKTMNNILWPLRGVVEQAVVDEYIDRNPFETVILSKIISKEAKKSDFEVDPFDRDEIKIILGKAEGQIKNLYEFAFFTGLRPSELIGLRWGDIDWVHGFARIKETVVDRENKDPKTAAGIREVLLLPPALAALKAQKAHTFLNDHRVFHNPLTNTPWETSQQLRRTVWMPLLKRAGVRYRNPYQTRHTYASMMISKGENIMWLSKQMGHADAEITLRKYTRWMPDATVKGGYKTQHNWSEYLEEQEEEMDVNEAANNILQIKKIIK